MSKREPQNVAASVRARLLNRTRETGTDFQLELQRYAAERFLYRLGTSRHRDRYVLKGAMLFVLWGGPTVRPTRDLDFTGYVRNDADEIISDLKEVCAAAVEDDGIVFDGDSFRPEEIRDDTEYRGLRVRFWANLAGARIRMQIDIGLGDAIEPPPSEVEYPTILDAPAPMIRAYPHDAVVAEKLHAMTVLGAANSRYKDFYDQYVLAEQFGFDGPTLTRAILATFERRRTPIEATLPTALTPRFYSDSGRAQQWRSYLSRNDLRGAPQDFAAAGEAIRTFLRAPWDALAGGQEFVQSWPPRGPWRTGTTP